MRLTLALLITLAAPAAAQTAGPYTVAETGEHFGKLDDALMSMRGRDATITIAPGVHRDCGIQQAGRITFRAERPGTAIFNGTACEGKAVLVLRGSGSVVDGLVFRGIRVPDGNGAGIRIEIGDLTVTNSMFLDSQEGILGNPQNSRRISIDRSTFAGLGQCDETPDCAHSIYLGTEGTVSVTNSRFERGRGGHYVKLRALNVSITDNSFDDVRGAKTNYMIDLPEGASGLIARNTFVQGRGKENWSALIAVAAEQRRYPSAGLRVEGNDARLAPGETRSPAFVANWSGERVMIGANRLGTGIKAYEAR
ncbi:right-handed parallel beta-helix repeat-containing protein [uncultured Sphingomonas sp.]|uniref:right-handed parallel beta-helix repeat-containing protein n=1 Tax=uncultured Sphingomonas sp. TaxID=158754 RepID=UPI0035C9F9B7